MSSASTEDRSAADEVCTEPPVWLPESVVQILQPFFPVGFNLRNVRLCSYIPAVVPAGAAAFTFGNRVYFAPGCYRTDCPEGIALIAHELCHVGQFRDRGMVAFPLSYGAEYLRNRLKGLNHMKAYEQIGFEAQARALEQRVRTALQGQLAGA